jgi:hypothetical protein
MKSIPVIDWSIPKYEENHGFISVKLGDHLIVAGVYNVRWPDGHHENLRVKMIPQGNTSTPHFEVSYHGQLVLFPVWLSGAEMKPVSQSRPWKPKK